MLPVELTRDHGSRTGTCDPQGSGKSRLDGRRSGFIEANEAFAAQSIAVARELGWADKMDKVNVNGGAIAIGHPIGASGARILVTLLYEMQKRESKYGLATLCIGGGMGTALIVEECSFTIQVNCDSGLAFRWGPSVPTN